MKDNVTEQELKAHCIAPRVTAEQLDSKIAEIYFHQFPGTTTIACLLVLENGFTTVGYSACAYAENFSREIGEKLAFNMARDKVWALEGYLLKEHQYRSPIEEVLDEVVEEIAEAGDKVESWWGSLVKQIK